MHTLKELHLRTKVEGLSFDIETEVTEGMFTNGQKQLIFLARAIIQKSKIVFYEESNDVHDD